jgi:hypothetical protein
VDCSYYQDFANVLLADLYDVQKEPVDSFQQNRVKQAAFEWADYVLEAPEECFPKSDIDTAIQYKARYQ